MEGACGRRGRRRVGVCRGVSHPITMVQRGDEPSELKKNLSRRDEEHN